MSDKLDKNKDTIFVTGGIAQGGKPQTVENDRIKEVDKPTGDRQEGSPSTETEEVNKS